MLELENINVLVNISTLIGMWFALWKISTSVNSFTNRIDYIEKEQIEVKKDIMKMQAKHDASDTKVNDMYILIARMEAKLDIFIEQNKQ